jgi:hypothetical protein
MGDIKTYNDIGEKILKNPILKEKYEIDEPNLVRGKKTIETVLRQICMEKEKHATQEKSSTLSITKKLNFIFNI